MTQPNYLRGMTRAEMIPFDTADTTLTFTPGDLGYMVAGKFTPMGSVTVTTAFAGAAAQRKPAGTTGLGLRLFGNSTNGVIRVDTDGIWEYDRSDTIALVVGDFVAPSGTTTVAKAAAESIAIGRVVEPSAASAARVTIKLQSATVPAARSA